MRRLWLAVLCQVTLAGAQTPHWEYQIPANATERRETLPNGRFAVEYSLNGQLVGHRIIDPQLGQVLYEQPKLNGKDHGVMVMRDPAGWLTAASVWREGKLHGPREVWRTADTIDTETYHIAGQKVTREQYIAAQRTDRSLPPVDLLQRYRQPAAPAPALTPADQRLVDQFRATLAAAASAYAQPLDQRPTLEPVNPRPATLAKVWEAAQLAGRIDDPPTRVKLLLEAARTQTGYAARLFGYAGKTAFIDNTAQILGRLPGAIDRLADQPAQSAAWLETAGAWRELTKIALWGDHPHNKHACDREAKQSYDRAVALDRANEAAAAARAEANRPLPPRPVPPPVVAAAEPIPEARWEQAGLLRQALLDGTGPPAGQFAYVGIGADLVVDAGPVTIVESDQSDRVQTIPPGEPHALFRNTEIRTGATGKARIVYEDRSVFHIRSDASLLFQDADTIIIRQESFSSGSVAQDMLALFDSRRIRGDLRVSKRGQKFLVITPTAVLGPRGTCFEIGRAGGQESVRVYDGAVEVRTETDTAYLAPGQQAAVTAAAPPAITAFDASARLAATWPEAGPQASLEPVANTAVKDDGPCFWLLLLPANGQVVRREPDEQHQTPWEQVLVAGRPVGERLLDPATGRVIRDYGLDAEGAIHGISRGWHGNGKRASFATMRHGQAQGHAIQWDTAGVHPIKHVWFLNGREVPLEIYEAALAKDPSLPPPDLGMYCNDEPRPVNIDCGSTAPAQPPVQPPAPQALPDARLTFYWAPQDAFTPVPEAAAIPYGAANLIARLTYPRLARDSRVTVVWRQVGQPQPLLEQQATITAGGAVFQGIASMPPGQVFAAGQYQVTITIDGAGQLVGTVTVLDPPALGNRNVVDVYRDGLNSLGQALDGIQAGNLPTAEAAARRALPGLQTALANNPQLPDVQCALELAHAVAALGMLGRVAEARQRDQALVWAERVVGHARFVAARAREEVFRQQARELETKVGAILPQLRGR